MNDDEAGAWSGAGPWVHGDGGRGLGRFDDGHATSSASALASISVMVASPRRAMLSTWMNRLSQEPGVALQPEALTDPQSVGPSVRWRKPRILLLDKTLLDRLDAESLQTLHADIERTRVLLLWDQLCNGVVIDVLRHRFHGFLPTSCLPEVCLKAIRAVSQGELWLPRAALAKAVAELLPGTAVPPPSRDDASQALTRREQQIVALLHRGWSNKQIANELGVVEDTVKKHLQSVFGKLGVHRRTLVALRAPAGASPTASP
jgi:DNA-binding NarL/FixJ family response regulator